jgi:trigger factor
MKHRLLIILILFALFLAGCDKEAADAPEMLEGTVSPEDYPDFVQLGDYKDIVVEIPGQDEVTEADIKEQVDYALETSGESELTQENVKTVSGYETIEEYKEAVKKNLEQMNQSAWDAQLMNKAWDAALSNATLLKCPKDMYEKELAEVEAMYHNYTGMLGISYEEVLERFNLTEEDIQKKALDYVKSDMMVYAIAKAENITVSDEEYSLEVKKRMKYYNVDTEQELADALGEDTDLHFIFLADKIMEFVVDHAKTE